MANLTVTGFDEALKRLEELSRRDKTTMKAKKAVKAALPVLNAAAKSAVAASEHGSRATGSVAASIAPTAAKENAYGVYAVVKPTGRDAKAVRNAEKAGFLEYGVPGKMEPRPWRANAIAASEAQCTKIVEDTIKAEMGAE